MAHVPVEGGGGVALPLAEMADERPPHRPGHAGAAPLVGLQGRLWCGGGGHPTGSGRGHPGKRFSGKPEGRRGTNTCGVQHSTPGTAQRC